jgi:YHS domain-containing protein
MSKFVAALACLSLLAAVAVAGPNANKAKKCAAAKADCPQAAAKCGDCPASAKAAKGADCPASAKAAKGADCPAGSAKRADCPASAAKCEGVGKVAKDGTAVVKCSDGAKKVSVTKLTAARKYADYKGKRYYFKCDQCAPEFKKDPDAYAKRHGGFPIPKAGKATATK